MNACPNRRTGKGESLMEVGNLEYRLRADELNVSITVLVMKHIL